MLPLSEDLLARIDVVVAANPSIQPTRLNPLAAGALDALAWPEAARRDAELERAFHAWVRVARLVEVLDLAVVRALLEAGWVSAIQIGAAPRRRFAATMRAAAPAVPPETWLGVHIRARRVRQSLTPSYISALQRAEPVQPPKGPTTLRRT